MYLRYNLFQMWHCFIVQWMACGFFFHLLKSHKIARLNCIRISCQCMISGIIPEFFLCVSLLCVWQYKHIKCKGGAIVRNMPSVDAALVGDDTTTGLWSIPVSALSML